MEGVVNNYGIQNSLAYSRSKPLRKKIIKEDNDVKSLSQPFKLFRTVSVRFENKFSVVELLSHVSRSRWPSAYGNGRCALRSFRGELAFVCWGSFLLLSFIQDLPSFFRITRSQLRFIVRLNIWVSLRYEPYIYQETVYRWKELLIHYLQKYSSHLSGNVRFAQQWRPCDKDTCSTVVSIVIVWRRVLCIVSRWPASLADWAGFCVDVLLTTNQSINQSINAQQCDAAVCTTAESSKPATCRPGIPHALHPVLSHHVHQHDVSSVFIRASIERNETIVLIENRSLRRTSYS